MPLIRKPSQAAQTGAGAPQTALLEGTPDERRAAARALATADGVPILQQALATETDARVREAVLTSLARIGSAESAAAVIPYIRSDDAGLRTGALDALQAMPEAVAGQLAGLLTDPDPDVRLLACELARAAPGPEPARLLSEVLERDSEPNVCAAAIEVLAEIGGAETLPALRRCAARFADQPFLAFSATVAIERIGGERLG